MKSVCIVIATYNAQRTIERCLESIFEQRGYYAPPSAGHHPRKLEVILVDGGSTDKTLEIARLLCRRWRHQPGFSMKIIVRRGLSSEQAKAVGLMATKADVYCDMAADNYLPEKDFIKKLMEPMNIKSKIKNQKSPKNAFLEPEASSLALSRGASTGQAKIQVKNQKFEIIGSYPERYYYDPKDSLLNRYFALFGVNDPVAFYLGKADREGYYSDYKNYKSYKVVEFDENNMPTLGANGFFIKRDLLLKYADLKNFYHIDVIYDLIMSNVKTQMSKPNVKCQKLRFAIVRTTIGHDTGENLWSFLRKRRRYFKDLYLKNREKRRYHLYDPKRDFWKMVKFIFFSLTFVQPLWLSIRGFWGFRDFAWFLHPIICFLTVINYGFSYCCHKK